MKNLFRSACLSLFAGLLLPGITPNASAAPKKVLVVTVTTGFRHSSIPTAEQVLAKLAKESGAFTVDFVQQPPDEPRKPGKPRPPKGDVNDAQYRAALEKFKAEEAAYQEASAKWQPQVEAVLRKLSPAGLKNYDAVVFANTTGDLPLPDKQGFIDWVKAGHGFAGMHSATDTFRGHKPLDPYVEMIGAEFKGHGAQVEVDCLNQDAQHPACKHLSANWTVFDEIYLMNGFDRSKVHGLLGLDKHPNDKNMAGDYPVAWCKEFGKGRVFYTSLGHREDIWDDQTPPGFQRKNSPEVAKAYQQHILNGIKWALGLMPGDGKPQAK